MMSANRARTRDEKSLRIQTRLGRLLPMSLGSCIAVSALLVSSRSFVTGPARSLDRRSTIFAATVEDPPAPVKLDSLRSEAATARGISEADFWQLVGDSKVSEAVIASWSAKQLLVRLRDGELVAVKEESEVEDLRDKLLLKGITVRYPAGEDLSDQEALEKAQFGSEGAVATGLFTSIAVGVADSLLEIGGAVVLTGGEIEGQSLLEKKSPGEVVAEDIQLFEQAVERAEKVAAVEVGEASNAFTNWFSSVSHWSQDVWHGVFSNHAPGLGGIIEDSFMGLLTAVSVYSLYQMAFLKRKSDSFSGLAHTATGAMQIGIVLYAIIEERCLRESPGAVWAAFTWIIFMVNNITMWPLLKYFRGPEVQRVLFKLAYSFIISFQGIHAVAWSYQYPWLYWIVMPYWFWSVKKLYESSDNILALLPDGTLPGDLQEAARRRVKGIQNDTPTWVYSILNFAGAVFDNLYMAVYTWRGPAGFWGWSDANIPAVNDHLRTGLVKPAFGSLTISVLVFLATLVYRKKLDMNSALVLNVILASIGPWLILYYHKLIDFDEPWQPELYGDWPSSPYLVTHFGDLGALLLVPLSLFGMKALTAASTATAAELPPNLADHVDTSALAESIDTLSKH